MSKPVSTFNGEAHFPGVITTIGGIEDGDGEGLGVIQVATATNITTAATFVTQLSNVSGAWAVLQTAPGANTPSLYSMTYSNATVYLTAYDLTGGVPASPGTFDIYAKGNF